jgi:hypothetical protein
MAKAPVAWREVTRWTNHPGWWELALECGHEVRRPARAGRPAPRRASCPECLAAPYMYVMFSALAEAELTTGQKTSSLALAIIELGVAEGLVLIHGPDRGVRRYFEAGGAMRFDAQGNPWVPVTLGGVINSRFA